jgi:hypothetical protein
MLVLALLWMGMTAMLYITRQEPGSIRWIVYYDETSQSIRRVSPLGHGSERLYRTAFQLYSGYQHRGDFQPTYLHSSDGHWLLVNQHERFTFYNLYQHETPFSIENQKNGVGFVWVGDKFIFDDEGRAPEDDAFYTAFFQFDPATRQLTHLFASNDASASPDVSPDHRWIRYAGLEFARLDGSHHLSFAIPECEPLYRFPVFQWTEDAFWLPCEGDIYRLNLLDGTYKQVYQSDFTVVRFSPDGEWILVGDEDSSIYRLHLATLTLHALPAIGFDYRLAYTPGRWILDFNRHIRTDGIQAQDFPLWQEDYYYSGNEPVPAVLWSEGENMLYFRATPMGNQWISRHDFRTNQSEILYPYSSRYDLITLVDDRWLLYTDELDGIYRMRLSDKHRHRLTEGSNVFMTLANPIEKPLHYPLLLLLGGGLLLLSRLRI